MLGMCCCLLCACQQRMATQPSVRPDEGSVLHRDGRGNRPLMPGTVARGHLRTDAHLYTGKHPAEYARGKAFLAFAGGAQVLNALALVPVFGDRAVRHAEAVDTFPFAITKDVLEHGRNRYTIYCIVCHDALGTGKGKIVERGYTPPPSYHSERLRNVAVGHFFDVITNGYGSMPQYKEQIPPRDRWAIAAYVRVLQLSQHFPQSDLPANWRSESLTAQATEGKTP